MNDVLRDLALSKGVDPDDWTRDEQREACVELFEQDEISDQFWISDCLTEGVSMNAGERHALIEALKHPNAAMRHAAIGIIVERALVRFPLNSLGIVADENFEDWKFQERQAAFDQEIDSRREASRE